MFSYLDYSSLLDSWQLLRKKVLTAQGGRSTTESDLGPCGLSARLANKQLMNSAPATKYGVPRYSDLFKAAPFPWVPARPGKDEAGPAKD